MLMLMKHQKHGAHYVYSEQEAVDHERHGWVRPASLVMSERIDIQERTSDFTPIIEAVSEVIEHPKTLTLKRLGRPPKVANVISQLQ